MSVKRYSATLCSPIKMLVTNFFWNTVHSEGREFNVAGSLKTGEPYAIKVACMVRKRRVESAAPGI